MPKQDSGGAGTRYHLFFGIIMKFPSNNLFFTSDWHLDHTNIIKHSNRPFTNIHEMNETLIRNWNSVVPPDGHGFLLGDMIWKGSVGRIASLLGRLNGNLYMILGNHDRKYMNRYKELKLFKWVTDYEEINIKDEEFRGGNKLVILHHYAPLTFRNMHRGSWSLYGHSHGNLFEDQYVRRMDVGVDTNNYMPYTYEQIKAHMATKKERPRRKAIDHHVENSSWIRKIFKP